MFNPSMLELAREARGLTQAALAQRVGIKQGHISKIEHAQATPSDEVAGKLAAELQVPVSFFLQQEAVRPLPVTFYRKRKSLGAHTLRTIHARINILRMQVKTLLQSLEVPEGKVPFVDLERHGRGPEDVADELRISWRLPQGPIDNLTKVLEDAGILVVVCDFGDSKIDGMSMYEPQDGLPPIIFVSATVPGDRLRFTLAHELAHIIFHLHLPIPPAECETEADLFASEFLMPRREIRPYFTRITLDRLAALKQTWKVAMAALLKRAGQLGMMTERQQRYLWMQLSAAGWRTKEPVEIPRESPSLLIEVVKCHVNDLGYTEEQLCGLLHVYPPELQSTFGIGPTARATGLRVVK